MRRRELIGGIVSSAAVFPLGAHAQQLATPVIGFLSSRSPSESADVIAAFRRGLGESGFVEGKNLGIAFRWAEGHYDRLPALAAELVEQRVSLIYAAGGTVSALAAKAATSIIPIVFSAANDPVSLGLVVSLNRPSGNITGMSAFNASLVGKRLELMKEFLPTVRIVAYLLNRSSPSAEIESKAAIAAARALGIQLNILSATTVKEFDTVFATIATLRARGLVVAGEPFFDSERDRLVELSIRHAVPANFAWREYVLAGGLMSYGTSLPDSYRQAAIYASRILKGEKPADLPVMQPTKFHLAVNLKTAKTLGLTVPPTLLARADEVIE